MGNVLGLLSRPRPEPASERLPPGVLLEIFQFCVDANGTNALILSLVSKKWRAASYHNNAWQIWSRVDANLASSFAVEKAAHSLSLWSRHHRLPNTARLRISLFRSPLTNENSRTTDIAAMVALLRPFSMYWQSFSFSSNHHDGSDFFVALASIPSSAPLLESIELEGFSWKRGAIHGIAQILESSPLLQKVGLRGLKDAPAPVPPLPNIVLSRVTHFRVAGAGSAGLLAALLLPESTDLDLSSLRGDTLSRLLVTTPKAQRAVISRLSHDQKIPIPITLHHSVTTLDISSTCFEWLRRNGFPNLRSLVLQSKQKSSPCYIGAALRRCFKIAPPLLRSLNLRQVNVTNWSFFHFLDKDVPQLETLIFSECKFSTCTIDALKSPTSLARLSSLTIDRCMPLSVDQAVQIVASRQSASNNADRNWSGEIVFTAANAPSQIELDTLKQFATDVKIVAA
ncbi:hypothetical protein BOTBODRAFT_188070 [Botryobasidium botryosum FD-172 SS1]|uniref:F-box domain-containing protein n=1 Tax=Botryobasidium botryosum (strain FD-172 SS1) TaxID=930990 RepID=A0A067MRF7_BOTB1|nr:hypothetical protein BOTBODRAFT_188070 [Botryobasidium botryosum FD-172 SS1]